MTREIRGRFAVTVKWIEDLVQRQAVFVKDVKVMVDDSLFEDLLNLEERQKFWKGGSNDSNELWLWNFGEDNQVSFTQGVKFQLVPPNEVLALKLIIWSNFPVNNFFLKCIMCSVIISIRFLSWIFLGFVLKGIKTLLKVANAVSKVTISFLLKLFNLT